MTLDELDELLTRERVRFPHPLEMLASWPRAAGALILLDEQTRAPLEVTIREFATTLIWPDRLSDNARAMLGFRLDWGWHLVQTLRAGEHGAALYPADGWSTTAALEWCLIEAWEYPGVEHWKRIADLIDDTDGIEPPSAVDLN